jgi:hypothetical protein
MFGSPRLTLSSKRFQPVRSGGGTSRQLMRCSDTSATPDLSRAVLIRLWRVRNFVGVDLGYKQTVPSDFFSLPNDQVVEIGRQVAI